MKIQNRTRHIRNVLLTLTVLIGCSGVALGQTTTSPTAGDERIVVVMSDGASSVHKLADQRVKIRTDSGETEVPLRKIAYMYRGKARMYSEQGILSGEVLDAPMQVTTDDGTPKQIPVGEMLFLSTAQAELSGKVITRLEIVVADSKVTKTVFTEDAPSAKPETKAAKRARGEKKTKAASAPSTPRRIRVTILDDYSTERLFTISNPTHSTVVKKVTQTYSDIPVQGPPFPIEFDILKHQSYGTTALLTLNVRSTGKGGRGRTETFCYCAPTWDGSLVEGSTTRMKQEYLCLGGLEGSGEIYFFVEDRGKKEDDKERFMPGVHLYKTVSNVLRLPVRFE
jgi:hypothetical protein